MSIAPGDSALWSGLFGDPEFACLLDDAALIAALIRVEAALALAQGEEGVIPKDAARHIGSACAAARIAPADLAERSARDGVPVPGLVDALRGQMDAEAAEYLHWGATSQDILDTATVGQLGQALDLIGTRLSILLGDLADLAGTHAETVMLARTRSQAAMPTTFGAVVAGWGQPLLRTQERLDQLRPRLMRVSLHGAAGTDAAMGEAAPRVRERLARDLGLGHDDLPWHAARDGMTELGSVLAILAGSLAKIGQDVLLLAQTEVGELGLSGGGSSTMPQKVNPVAAEVLVTMGRVAARLQGGMYDALIHAQQRDGAAWAEEWHMLRQIVVAAGAALRTAGQMLDGMTVRDARMRQNLDAAGDGIYSEAAAFALSKVMPRSRAQAAVTAALKSPSPRRVLESEFPDLDWAGVFDPLSASGRARDQARGFADTMKGTQRGS